MPPVDQAAIPSQNDVLGDRRDKSKTERQAGRLPLGFVPDLLGLAPLDRHAAPERPLAGVIAH
jgi:hypothetical protein